ncbi:hypothetical protein TNCV_3133151 [Trichonephila clavipes]|nr:hypothetical protein TNCV_3133151 [Trichonephila clavipes]
MHCKDTRRLLVTDLIILNHGQVAKTTPELAPRSPNFQTTPEPGRLNIYIQCQDIFNVHWSPRHGGFSVALGSNSRHAGHKSVTRLPQPPILEINAFD